MNRLCSITVVGMLAFGLTAVTQAATITLSFDSLPSAQGWSFSSNGASEASVFSIVGGNTLAQNTLGLGGGGAGYELLGVIDPDVSFSVSFTARILTEETSPGLGPFGAFTVYAQTGSEVFGIGLGPNRIAAITQVVLSTAIDTSVFHDYRMVVTPGVGFDLFVDNVFVGAGSPRMETGPNGLFIGDSTAGQNAQGEYTAFVFQQPAPIPLPAALWLMGLGLASLCARRLPLRTEKS